MATKTYKTTCTECQSPAYYYPVKLLLESKDLNRKIDVKRTVSVTCTGQKTGVKHTLDYTFPTDFQQSN